MDITKCNNIQRIAEQKQPKMANCIYELSVFRGRLTLDEQRLKDDGRTQYISQAGQGNIRINKLKFRGSHN
jgi:hypothetical protein